MKKPSITISKALRIPRWEALKSSLLVPTGARLIWDEMAANAPPRASVESGKVETRKLRIQTGQRVQMVVHYRVG